MDRPSWKRKLGVALGSLVVAAGIAELGARLRWGTPLAERLPISRIQAHPTRGWEMVPGEDHYTYHHPVAINSLGLRGEEVPPRDPDAPELRVLALGDSLIYGQGVADDQTLPVHLEAALEEGDPAGRAWRVVNGGHRAYDTAQELALLEDLGPVIAPDVVVLFWYWNDLKERDMAATHAYYTETGPVPFDTGVPMEGGVKLRWQLLQLLRRSALVMTLHDALQARSDAEQPPEAFVDQGMERLEEHLVSFRDAAAAAGRLAVVAIVPDANELLGPHPSADISARAADRARAVGLPVIALVEALEPAYREEGRLPVVPYDGHYDGEGNRRMARFLARELLTLVAGGR